MLEIVLLIALYFCGVLNIWTGLLAIALPSFLMACIEQDIRNNGGR